MRTGRDRGCSNRLPPGGLTRTVPLGPPEGTRGAPPGASGVPPAPIPPANPHLTQPERDRKPRSSKRKKKSGTDPFNRFSTAVGPPLKDVLGDIISGEELADLVESLYGIWWNARAAQARHFPPAPQAPSQPPSYGQFEPPWPSAPFRPPTYGRFEQLGPRDDPPWRDFPPGWGPGRRDRVSSREWRSAPVRERPGGSARSRPCDDMSDDASSDSG
jgi:hypothetical protein